MGWDEKASLLNAVACCGLQTNDEFKAHRDWHGSGVDTAGLLMQTDSVCPPSNALEGFAFALGADSLPIIGT